MSRLHYSFQDNPRRLSAQFAGRQPCTPLRAKMRDRRYLRNVVETAGLFAFGFGSASLVLRLAAGFFLIYRGTGLHPLMHM